MAMNVLVGLSYVSEDIDAGPALEEMVGVLRQTGNRMMQIVWLGNWLIDDGWREISMERSERSTKPWRS
jgi:hypothetical protein